jgi:hypothetical protein
VTSEATIKILVVKTNTKDNIPPIEEVMEHKPYGLRIF